MQPSRISRYSYNILLNLRKIDLPSITHAMFHNEIRIRSAICALIMRWSHLKQPLYC